MRPWLSIARTSQRTTPGTLETVMDRPHDLGGCDIFSAGADGVLQYGKGDDVSSWEIQK